jgi:hypothetical protein
MGLFDFFKNKENGNIPEGLCANCWGYQEYEGIYIAMAKDRQIDINNHDSTATKAFVQDFITTQLDGIRLIKEHNTFVCPRCKTGYKDVIPKI